ncbi:succinate dehydrogenase [Sorangium cellulosum]|uniref:Succinate dehydrogenase n=1 Tax=Sorangium cellulosum TaxID=56 RepID=A0A4P2Q872_SORCE|nr:succinate dehydrogenase cytochrome b subunit [Sorangium cellulosum]AUX25368.1 succinate dehydrogenase [Sorangium cellulosum]
MSSTAAPSTLPSRAQRVALFYRDLVGKKFAMALSGVIFFGYVIGHMAGNLQIFMGRQKINDYAAFLHGTPSLLWGTRIVLLLAFIVHVYTGITLAQHSRAARPVRYQVKGQRHPNVAARTMLLSGLVVGAFIVYHLLHLTTGTVHPDFVPLAPYENLVNGFQQTPVAIAYIVAVSLLGLHLYHGAWSMFQSMGVSHPRYTPVLRKLAVVSSILLVVGFSSVPLAVMTGLVR